MKVAKLPNGKTLKFADDMPDSAIDAIAREHMKDHIQKTRSNEEKEYQSAQEMAQRHQDLLQGLSTIAGLLQNFIEEAKQGHSELISGMKETTKAIKTPKKTRLIRDEKTGKATGAEEYFET